MNWTSRTAYAYYCFTRLREEFYAFVGKTPSYKKEAEKGNIQVLFQKYVWNEAGPARKRTLSEKNHKKVIKEMLACYQDALFEHGSVQLPKLGRVYISRLTPGKNTTKFSKHDNSHTGGYAYGFRRKHTQSLEIMRFFWFRSARPFRERLNKTLLNNKNAQIKYINGNV